MINDNPSGTLSAREVARILKVDVRTLRQMVGSGLIRTASPGTPNRLRFHLSEVAAASRIRNARVELPHVSNVAHRALALAEMTERRLGELYALLGIGCVVLPVDQEAVEHLYAEASKLLELEHPDLSIDDVRSWARAFLAMTDAYLRLTEDTTGKAETWQTFTALADKLCAQAPRGMFNFHKDLEAAYGFLEAGRRNVLACAFFFVRNRHGHNIARKLFPDRRKTLDDAVLAFLPET